MGLYQKGKRFKSSLKRLVKNVFCRMAMTEKKKQKLHHTVTFKPYVQNQGWLFPPSLEELIPSEHLVRLISQAIDGLDLSSLINAYQGGGTSSYHPKMMLKVLVYGYVKKLYSSRAIAEALRENIGFMWLSGNQQPDHNSLNRFRSSRMKQTVKDVFAQVLYLLIEQGRVHLNDYYIDGTKMESVAGRYTFVWAKNTARYKSKVLDKIAALLEQIESVNEQTEKVASKNEAAVSDRPSIAESEALRQTIAEMNVRLADQLGENKALKKKLSTLEKDLLPKLEKYEEQEKLLDGRNSYSKTDVDATFMRTKEDHLQNGQLKPCYNIQLGTENQYIINYTVHQTSSDMAVFTSHMDDTLELLETIQAPKPRNVGADAGYGSEENYEFLEKAGIEAYVKYSGYYKERKGKASRWHFPPSTLYYHETEDYFICPMGQKMKFIGTQRKTSKTGFEQTVHRYQAQRCMNCPLRGACHKGQTERIIEVSHKSRKYRQQAKDRLQTLKGRRMKTQRNIDVEAVFGHLKHNRDFRRFKLRSLDGVHTEMGLLALAHNFKKWHTQWSKRGRVVPMKPGKSPHPANNQAKMAKRA